MNNFKVGQYLKDKHDLEPSQHLGLRDQGFISGFFAGIKYGSANVKDTLDEMTDAQRMEIFGQWCRYCGSDDPNCQCWNDE